MKRKHSILFLLFLLPAVLFAQQMYRGRVTDVETGNGIPGAVVRASQTNGTTTDTAGYFNIRAASGTVLEITSLGYDRSTFTLGNDTEISIPLMQSAAQAAGSEVVVIGYGVANRRDLTGSIVKISGEEVAYKPNTNPVASLQGRVAGLTIVNSGTPGQEPDIRIRGTVSLNQTKPLYIVDGIFNDNMNFVNPADVESIEVLKDPSSLAIFGVRGANGVIIVTTKQGKAGRLAVNVNSSLGLKKVVDIPKLTDAEGFKLLYNEQRENDGLAPFAYYDVFNGNTNWIDLLLNKQAMVNNNNVSISSGSEKNKFYMGIGYIKEEGVLKYEDLDKITLNISNELRLSNRFRVGFSLNGYRAMLPKTFGLGGALLATPIVTPFNEEYGVYNKLPDEIGGAQIGNPLMALEMTKYTAINREYRIVGNAFAEVDFLKDFTFRANFLTDLGFNDGRSYSPLINVYSGETGKVVEMNGFTRTSVNQYKNIYNKFQQDYLLTYKKRIGDHNVTALGGFTTYYNDYSQVSGNVQQYVNREPIPNDPRWWYLNVFPYGDPTTRYANSGQWERTTVSYLLRVLYNYQSKYLLNASFRRDGSSEISPNNRFENFWALGAAWELAREDFMKDQTFFDGLKIKASIGKLGNQYTNVNYPYYPNYVTGATAVFGDNIVPAYVLAYRNNPNLKWETVTSYEAGIEANALKRRLFFEGNYYSRTTNDLLTFVSEGSERFYTNSGSINSHGFEFTARWADNITNDLSYNVGGNITTINNKVLSIFRTGYEIIEGQSRSSEGLPIGSFYGYVHDGIYQSYADKLASPDASSLGSYGPGDIRYKDINGDGKVDPADRTIIGNPTPDFTYGLDAGLNYKGIDVNVEFQGVFGNEIWRAWGVDNSFAQFNYRTARLERWTEPGSSNWEPRAISKNTINRTNSTYMIEDGSYFRVRNLQLGYTFNPEWLAKASITSLRIYLSGQNIKTWKRNSGFTPEAGGSATAFGVDNGGYPLPAIYTVGFNLNF